MRWPLFRSILSVSVVLPLLGLALLLTTASLAVTDAKGYAVTVTTRTPVVLIVFDEFPTSSLMRADGSVDATRYPGFGRLAHGGTWFSRATSVHDRTSQAVPAILTGERPRRGALPTLNDHPSNLFTLLGGTYTFKVREPVTRLCPVRDCPDHESHTPILVRVGRLVEDVGIDYLHAALPADLQGDLSPIREGWAARLGDAGDPGMRRFVRSLGPSDPARTLYFLHVLAPHEPWVRLPSGDQYNASPILGLKEDWKPGDISQWRGEEELIARGMQRHLLEVGYVDRFLSTVLDRLRSTGLYDRALVVVTADHGVSVRPNGNRRSVTLANVGDIAPVPLFVKYPGQARGREDRRDASTIDVLPTIADVLGIDLPWHADGVSLRTRPVERRVRISSPDGPDVSIEPQALAARLLATARRNARWFGVGTASLYRLGPRPDLLGRPISSLRRSVAGGAQLDLAQAPLLANVHRESGFLPVHLLGPVSWAGLRPSDILAMAINGRVAATTKPFDYRNTPWFDAVVDESAIRDGRNDLAVYAVRGIGRDTRLILLGGNVDAATTTSAASTG